MDSATMPTGRGSAAHTDVALRPIAARVKKRAADRPREIVLALTAASSFMYCNHSEYGISNHNDMRRRNYERSGARF